MVEINIQDEEIVFRFLVVDAALGDAASFLRESARDQDSSGSPQRLHTIHAGGDRIVVARREPPVPRLFDMRVVIDAVGVSAPLRSVANAKLLLQCADAVVVRSAEVARTGFEEECVARLGALFEAAGRDPASTALVVLADGAGAEQRWREAAARSAFKPRFDVATGCLADAFSRAEAAVLCEFRGYEAELKDRGLSRHIKIGSQLYEKIEIPWEGAPRAELIGGAADTRDRRLLRRDDDAKAGPQVRINARLLAFALALLIALVAYAIARRI